ncbi:MAG: hypothetical protein JWM82_1764 [Myxococcales bacterium]|nr:hypothetical protein [Myxococcales bacterium]
MKRIAPLAVGCLALWACGGRGLFAGAPDARDAAPPETLFGHSFDVTATLTVTAPAGDEGVWLDFPKTHTFTLVFDAESRRTLIAARGFDGATTSIAAGDGTGTTTLVMTLPYERSCTRDAELVFDRVSFIVRDGVLTGTAQGRAEFQTGADDFSSPITATLAGVADLTPPALTMPTSAVDPLASLSFEASEPLPATVTARLVGAPSGDVIPLEPTRIAGPERAIRGFAKPELMLRAGDTYTVSVQGLTDFAGNAGAAPSSTFTTRAVPPLAAQDGFESLTGDTYGGAGVLADGPLTAIAGTKSLLLNTGFGGGFGFLPYDLGPSLTVRLAVPKGATVVRFERRLVAPDPTPAAAFVGAVRLASLLRPVETMMNVAATGFQVVTLPGAGDVYVSSVATVELPLPPGVTDEVTFEIDGVTFQCGLPPSPTLLVVDDLRVE